MKGPGFRLDLDPRRAWECPACGKRLKMPGDVTFLICDCRSDNPPFMRLVERVRKTESPFDHVGFAAQKRIDAALRKSPNCDASASDDAEGIDIARSALPETTHEIDADAPPPSAEYPEPPTAEPDSSEASP